MDKIIEGHFNFAYPNNNVFEHTYLDIDYGDIVLVIGRNGIGKSTLLKLLARIEKFSQYSDIKHHISKSHISYMPSNISFYPQMRGLDLVSFYRDLNPDFDLAYAQKYLQAFNID